MWSVPNRHLTRSQPLRRQAGVSVSDISNAVAAEGGVSEAAANIGLRTQTIQTLRDGFYRVCEAYMNGLSEEQYSIMLRRFQTNMIALLAIEQLTGAVKGGDAVVSASAGSGMDSVSNTCNAPPSRQPNKRACRMKSSRLMMKSPF